MLLNFTPQFIGKYHERAPFNVIIFIFMLFECSPSRNNESTGTLRLASLTLYVIKTDLSLGYAWYIVKRELSIAR